MVNIFCLHVVQPGSLPTSTGFKTFWSLKLSIVRHSSSLFSCIVLLHGGYSSAEKLAVENHKATNSQKEIIIGDGDLLVGSLRVVGP